jgi:predicted aconitase with swiveling domain
LCESLRLGTGPAAIILPAPDTLILAAVTIAAELYERVTPVLAFDMAHWPELTRCKMLRIDTDGNVSEL